MKRALDAMLAAGVLMACNCQQKVYGTLDEVCARSGLEKPCRLCRIIPTENNRFLSRRLPSAASDRVLVSTASM